MEQILCKLSEIEATAKGIMAEADRRKEALSEEMEKACKEFDAVLDRDTDDKIRKIRENLEAEKNARLSALRADTAQAYKHLDSYYEANHERLSRELFERIIQA